MLGGSRFQIGGPAGAFIVLVAATVERHGVDGLLLATAISGLTLAGREPTELLPKLQALLQGLPTFNPSALAVAGGTVAIIVAQRRWAPRVPGLLIAVALAAVATSAFGLPVETVGSRFGGIPGGLPVPAVPTVSWAKLQAVLPDAAAFALLGAIESLLSATVADGMTGRRHRLNGELLAQGVANIGSALVGGICVTGTVARTATNVRAGARGPVAGMLHSVFLLGFMLLAAPLAAHIPMAALAGVLVVVAWGMAEKYAFASLLRGPRGDGAVLLSTFLLTVFVDLMQGIVVGFALGALLFIHRMSLAAGIEAAPLPERDEPPERRTVYDPELAARSDVVVYRVTGAFFFGTASTLGAVLDRIADQRRTFVLDLAQAPYLDSTGAHTVESVGRRAGRNGVRLIVAGANPTVRGALEAHGVGPPLVEFRDDLAAALADLDARG